MDRQRAQVKGGSEAAPLLRVLADQAFSRAAGAPLSTGNSVRLLRDAGENYPAWLDAIGGAKRHVHFENYIIHEDREGGRFADALIAKAREGVPVRLLYDWLGGLGKTSGRYWQRLRDGGVEVRRFNPPSLGSPFGWLTRDHRKMLAVDGDVAFVTGLCVGEVWVGDQRRGREPWRDTGVEIRGPAVADAEAAFARVWKETGEPLPPDVPPVDAPGPAGDVALRVIAGEPNTAGLYRLDKLVAALARRTLWITDAYFVGTTSYVQGLVSAARDGVDVRLLVPGSSDIPVVSALSRAGYRPLLEGGVRVFEWNGTMIHAKTAVADSHWARIGSTNLNLASWIGNWELDVAVEDDGFARRVEEMYLNDLAHSTEIVLGQRSRVSLGDQPEKRSRAARAGAGEGSAGRVLAGAVGVGNAIGAAITNHRALGPKEARVLASGGALLLVLAAVALFFPRVLTVPLSVVGTWVACSLLVRAYRLHAQASLPAAPTTGRTTAVEKVPHE
jgi:cardiolipin synthase